MDLISIMFFLSSIPYFSLSPKCYYGICKDTENYKRSSKGVQARVLLSYDDYKAALYDSTVKNVDNISIRLHNKEMKTIQSTKRALKNALYKAFVHDDKVTVSPFKKLQ